MDRGYHGMSLVFVFISWMVFYVSGTVYMTTSRPYPYLGSLDIQTGNLTNVVQFHKPYLDGLWWESGVDPVNKKYSWYMQSKEGLRLATAFINDDNYTISPPLYATQNPLGLTWDPQNNLIYQVTYTENSNGSIRSLTSVNPDTWEVKLLYSWGYNDGKSFIDLVYDYNNHLLYMPFEIVPAKGQEILEILEIFDTDSLTMKKSINITKGPGIDEFSAEHSFDFKSGLIYGLTHYDSLDLWGLTSIDITTGITSPASNPTFPSSGWSVGVAQSAIDPDTGYFSKFFFSITENQNYLVTLDLSGNLIASPILQSSDGIGSFGAA